MANATAETVCKGLVRIKKITALLMALYMLVGTGRLGLDGNKILADKIEATVSKSAETVDKSAGILSLEETDYNKVAINLN